MWVKGTDFTPPESGYYWRRNYGHSELTWVQRQGPADYQFHFLQGDMRWYRKAQQETSEFYTVAVTPPK